MSSVEAVRADVAAKTGARNLMVEMEVCFTDQQTYERCDPGRTLPDVSVTTTDFGYTLTAKSKSGNEFVVNRAADGTAERTCTKKGEGDCPSAGASTGNDW